MKLVGNGPSAVELCQKVVTIGEHCEKLFSSSRLLALFCSELKLELDMVWLDLVALIPSVDTFLESCIQLANFDTNWENHENGDRDERKEAGPQLRPPSTTSWFQTVPWPFSVPLEYLSNLWETSVTPVTPNESLATASVKRDFRKEFDELFDNCIEKWEPIPNKIEEFLDTKWKPLLDKCSSQHQEAVKLESLQMCTCRCCGGLGALSLATAGTAIVAGAIHSFVPEKLPAAVVEVVEPEMFKYAWFAVLALIILPGVCIYSAYSMWVCRKKCQQIVNSLECVRDEMQEMQKILKTTRNQGEYCIAHVKQVRQKLENPDKDELNELLEQIRNDATQLKHRLKKLFKERNENPT